MDFDAQTPRPDRPASGNTRSGEHFDPSSVEFRLDRYAVYRRFRERDPVHWLASPTPGKPGRWMVFRHADVSTALADERFGREALSPPQSADTDAAGRYYPAYWRMISDWMIFRDPPRHQRLRTPAAQAFSLCGPARLRPRVNKLVQRLLARLVGRDSFEVVADFAFPLPGLIISEVLGLEIDDLDMLQEWSMAIIAALDALPNESTLARADSAASAMYAHIETVLASRRAYPKSDLISELALRSNLSDREIVSNCCFLVGAGQETTRDLIANGLYSLLTQPNELARLLASPQLVENAVEEILRFESPVQVTARVAQADVALGGKQVRAGDRVDLVLGSANRDPTVFDNPDRLDLGRSCTQHVAFGEGPHYCLGAGLARIEAQVALDMLLRQFPKLRLSGGPPRWRPTFAFRSLERLTVEI